MECEMSASHAAVDVPCIWKGNCRSYVTMAMRGISTRLLNGPRKVNYKISIKHLA